MAWYTGKVLNPELNAAVHKHRREHTDWEGSCNLDSPTFVSPAAHNAWRNHFKKHTGQWPPKTWLTPEDVNKNVNPNQIKPQGNIRLDIEARKMEEDEE